MRVRKLEGMYAEIETETRCALEKLPQSDLEAVVRFLEALQTIRSGQ